MNTRWHSIDPELPTTDIQSSLKYFERHLGFTTVFHLEESGYAKTARDGNAIFLARVSTPFEPRTCMIYTEDIHQVYRELVDSGATITSEPKQLSVGTTEFSIVIPDGHVFTFFS
jgi:predicted enzyme related to lactoylglutathione lyase